MDLIGVTFVQISCWRQARRVVNAALLSNFGGCVTYLGPSRNFVPIGINRKNNDPFVDAKACGKYVDMFREKLGARIAEENSK